MKSGMEAYIHVTFMSIQDISILYCGCHDSMRGLKAKESMTIPHRKLFVLEQDWTTCIMSSHKISAPSIKWGQEKCYPPVFGSGKESTT